MSEDAKRERVHDIGYINDDMEHVLLGFKNPALLNPGADFVQVAITIETAIELRARLNAFLIEHGVSFN